MNPNQNFQQQQQEQLRRQQEEQRRRMMGAAWLSEQERKAASVQNAPSGWLQRRRDEALQEMRSVRSAFESGRLNQVEAEERLQRNVLQDESGTLWAVGCQSEAWYRWDNGRWVRSGSAGSPGSAPAAQGRGFFARAWSFLWRAVIFFLLGYAAAFLANGICEMFGVGYSERDTITLVAAGLVWLFGLWKSWQAASK